MKNRRKSANRKTTNGAPSSMERIYGVHAVNAALANPMRQVSGVFATRNGLTRLTGSIEPHASVTEVRPDELTRRLGRDAVHQGVMIEAAPITQPSLSDVLAAPSASGPLLVLDQITDPHNLGAILRSAAAFGAPGAVMTRRNSPPLDGVVAKAASGAVEHVPVILVANLARGLEEIGDAGFQRIGLDSSTDHPLETADISFPCALALGAEHKGLRRLTQEKCDLLCRLTTVGPIASLNVSNAAAVAMHTLVLRTRG